LGSFFELDLLKKQIGHQSPQQGVLELQFSNSAAPGGYPMWLARSVDCDESTLRLRLRLAPPVQGHDTHTERARDFAVRFSLRHQIICLG